MTASLWIPPMRTITIAGLATPPRVAAVAFPPRRETMRWTPQAHKTSPTMAVKRQHSAATQGWPSEIFTKNAERSSGPVHKAKDESNLRRPQRPKRSVGSSPPTDSPRDPSGSDGPQSHRSRCPEWRREQQTVTGSPTRRRATRAGGSIDRERWAARQTRNQAGPRSATPRTTDTVTMRWATGLAPVWSATLAHPGTEGPSQPGTAPEDSSGHSPAAWGP